MTIDFDLLRQMIECAKRETSFRYAVYPKWVKMGKMTLTEAEKEKSLMYGIQRALQKIYDGTAPQNVQLALFEEDK